MYDAIVKVLKAIATILGIAAAQVAVEELDKYAYPSRRRTGYTPYSRVRRPRTMAEADAMERRRINRVRREQAAQGEKFHDVLMVAFDIKGVNKDLVHEWLRDHMPSTGSHMDNVGEEVYLDSWWIADDQADSDCDSAVFVPKGQQNECRQLLAENNFRLHN